MKNPITLLLVLFYCTTFAADNDNSQKKVSQHVQFMFGEYAGMVGTHKGPPQPWLDGSTSQSIAMISYSFGFLYKAEWKERFGLRTGINYFTYGTRVTGVNAIEQGFKYTETAFNSSFNIPLHFLYYKQMKKGRLVFTSGPDAYLPVNVFGVNSLNGIYRFHNTVNLYDFDHESSLGFTIGLGYEKKLKKNLAIEFMPDFRVLNLIPFNPIDGIQTFKKYPYSFQMALGLSTYITFY